MGSPFRVYTIADFDQGGAAGLLHRSPTAPYGGRAPPANTRFDPQRGDIMHWYLYLRNLLRTEEGQDITEYALLIALIAIGLVGAVLAFRNELGNLFSQIVTRIQPFP
jgi:Flp pilus assembly pilin Flp